MKATLFILGLVLFSISLPAARQTFWAEDVPWDEGKAIKLTWHTTADTIHIQKADSLGNWETIYNGANQPAVYKDADLKPGQSYTYRLLVPQSTINKPTNPDNPSDKDSLFYIVSVIPREQWFYMHKLSYLLILLIISAAIVYYIQSARMGKDYFIRRIGGLDSMEEAVGRATEKGKPILFVPGIGDLDDIQTIASLTILSHLAQRSAEYNTELIVPCRFSMVLSAAREVVKEAYLRVGKPDAYKEERVFYLTDDQFGYVAGIDGIMVREQPAANFFLGSFYAESLILAETGYSTGAIQTSGTAQASQLPFFVVSCDYTLIGEELFAASAYLSRDPQQLGSLKGHDFGKILVIFLILAGVVTEIVGWHWFKTFFEGVQV